MTDRPVDTGKPEQGLKRHEQRLPPFGASDLELERCGWHRAHTGRLVRHPMPTDHPLHRRQIRRRPPSHLAWT